MNATAKPLIKKGWLRALLFLIPWIILMSLVEVGTSALISRYNGGNEFETGDNIETAVKLTIAAMATMLIIWLWHKLVDRKNFKSLGFEWQPFKNDALIGLFAAPAIIGAGTLILIGLTYLQFNGVSNNFFKLLWEGLLMIAIACSEEILVRGYILNNLLQSFNKWVALGISASFFAAMHLANPDVTALSITNILVAGFFLGINYIYTKNLWFGIFLHFSWNFVQGPLFGYEVSGIPFTGLFNQSVQGPEILTGGSFGFEGSLLCPLLSIVATLVFALYFGKRYATSP